VPRVAPTLETTKHTLQTRTVVSRTVAASPFSPLEPTKPTLAQRLLQRSPARNALIVLHGMLPAAASPREVKAEDVARIERTYGVDIGASFHGELERSYREYMLFCLTDRRLSEEEVADLDHLRMLFRLDARTCEAIQRNVARQVYLRSVTDVLADGTIDAAEREFLHRLQEHLAIPESIADNILEVKEQQYRSRNRRDVRRS